MEEQVIDNQSAESGAQTEAEVSSTVVSTSEVTAEKDRRLEKMGKKVEKAPDPVEKKPPETEAVDQKEVPNNTGNEKLIKKLGKQKEEIGKKTRQNYDLRRKNAELQQRIAELEKLAQSAPKRESFQNENDFLKAEIKHETKVELEKERLNEDIQNANAEYHENITSRMREQLKEPESVIKFYTQYHDRIKQDEPEIYEYVTSGSKYGPIVLERFLNHTLANEEVYSQWRNSTAYSRMKQISQLEDYLDSLQTKAPAQQQRSGAPEPIAPSKGESGSSANGEESLEAMIARAKQRRLNR